MDLVPDGVTVAARMSRDDWVLTGSPDAMEELGCEEVFLVPATADLAEVERAAEIVARRG